MNVLIIGLGSIAQKHVDALLTIAPDSIIYALRTQKNSKTYRNVNNIYALDEVEWKCIDFAIISNPTSCHKQTIKDLIQYEVPLFIEKPLFNDLSGESVIEAIREKNIISYVACNLRFLGCLQFIKEFVRDKRINEVNCYCGSFLPNWRPDTNYKTVYSSDKDLGGGVHLDLIHELDYIYWIWGSPLFARATRTNKSDIDINASDYANYFLEYKLFNISVILNYYRRDAKRTAEILLDMGTLSVDLLANKVVLNGKDVFSSEKNIKDTYLEQMHFFIKNILTRRSEFNNASEAYKVLELCLKED